MDTHLISKGHCDCVRCTFDRLEFHKCLPLLKQEPVDLQEKLRLAFINYKVGNFLTACMLLMSVRQTAQKMKKYMVFFIAQYNLRHLGHLLTNPFHDFGISLEMAAELAEIDPMEDYLKLKSQTDYDLIAFIADGYFFRDALENISALVIEIEDHYASFLKGGWSNNSNAASLVEEFAKLDYFLNRNFIIYDAYSNFDGFLAW